MGFLFSKPKKQKRETPAMSEQDRAVLDLKRQRDRLKKYETKIDQVAVREKEMAKLLLSQGRKDRALLCLKKKKYQEQLLERTRGQLLNVEQLVNSIEFASMQNEVFQALKDGNTCLEALNAEVDVEEVEQLMEDTADAIAYTNEVSEALGQKLSEEDEDEVNAMFAALEDEIALEDEQALPEAPVTNVTTQPMTTEQVTPVEGEVEVKQQEEEEKPALVLA
ncbi:MAG: hypothetical protein MHM6MM_002348 [Cercozoa sp. M6MM]